MCRASGFSKYKIAMFRHGCRTKSLANDLTHQDDARLQEAAEEEYRRLLYVGMTRAADRLIVCGYRGKRENDETWQAMIARSLATDKARCVQATFSSPDGDWGGYQWREVGFVRIFPPWERTVEGQKEISKAVPSDLFKPLPPNRPLPRPLSPSGAGF